ncbi:MAG: gliding motility-associated C-terminal domain-containing protein [Bacteroidetes bacterium]|nr:gliding motility-associated C-terminal domain-containing protein [Bacteroidota bacterium]
MLTGTKELFFMQANRFVIASLIVLMNFSFSPAQNTFFKTVGHVTEGSEGRTVAQAIDGGYFLSYYIYYASNYIPCLTKFNCAGVKEWEKFYDGGMITIPAQIIAQSDNGCLLSFSINSNNGIWQNVVVKVDENGDTKWTRRLKMQVAGITGSMVQHNDGSIYLCGSDTVAPTGTRGTTIAKLSSSGNILWQKHYADGQDHSPRGLVITADNKVAVFGYAGFDMFSFSNLFVFTTTLNGQFLKRKVFSTYYDDEPHAICADASGNIYITGRSYFLNTQWDIMFLKLNSQLQILQSNFIDGNTSNGEVGRYNLFTTDNAIAIFGDEGGWDERNPMILKLNLNGNPIWTKRYPISPLYTNYIFHGAQCNDGGYLMTGDARPITQFRIAPFLKIAANGDMGCTTSDFPISVRNEIMTVLDTSLNTYSVPYLMDTAVMNYSVLSLSTSNTSFCQQLIPCGNFLTELDTICPVNCFTFQDQSVNAGTWSWYFENGIPSSSTEQFPPQVCFPSPGMHLVSLKLTNPVGSVTYTQFINATNECPIFIPTIFTPNGDGINDVFHAKGINDNFTLQIFSRWGNEVFSSGLPGKWWNGHSNNGQKAVAGIYFFILYHNQSGKTYKGTVQLVD